jgi:hypothetical protein
MSRSLTKQENLLTIIAAVMSPADSLPTIHNYTWLCCRSAFSGSARKVGSSFGTRRSCTGHVLVPKSLCSNPAWYLAGWHVTNISITKRIFYNTFNIEITMLQAGRSRVLFPMRSLFLFNRRNPSSRTMALGSTQLLTEMSTRYILGDKVRPALKTDNLTVICEPIV